MNHFISAILIIFVFLGCKESKNNSSTYTERLDIYDAISDSTSYSKGKLIYVEISTYLDSIKQYTVFQNPDGSIKGKEVYIFESNKKEPTGSEYYDPRDSLLSYYKYVYSNKNIMLSITSFDASNDEVLRIDQFDYDNNNFVKQKDILESDNTLNRRYIFVNDIYGNATQMVIQNGNAETIATENYKIVAYDGQNKWTERWGFVNDIPKTYHKKSFD